MYEIQKNSINTHGTKSLTIPAIAYFINSLYGQGSVRDRGNPTWLYIGDISCKTITEPIFENLYLQPKGFLGESHNFDQFF